MASTAYVGLADTSAAYGTLNAATFDAVTVSTASPAAPAAPSSVAATGGSASQVTLTWSDNSDNEQGFKVERKTGAGGTYAQVTTVYAGVTTYQDTGLTSGTTYYFRIRAYNAGGDSAYAAEASVTTAGLPAPSGLAATAVAPTAVTLTWSDNAGTEAGYRIQRSADGVTYAVAGETAADSTSFVDTGLTGGGTYAYRVTAFAEPNESSAAAAASAQTPASAAPATNGLTVNYYDDALFGGAAVGPATVNNVDFNFGNGAPAGTAGDFSAVFTGQIQPRYSEAYTFTTLADGGARVFVDGKLVVDAWSDVGQIQGDANRDGYVNTPDFNLFYANLNGYGGWEQGDFTGDGSVGFGDYQAMQVGWLKSQLPAAGAAAQTITLQANQAYDVRVEYFNETAFASLQLFWQSASQAREVVPQSRLLPDAAPPSVTLTAPTSSSSQIGLSWSSGLSGVEGYRVEYSMDGSEFTPMFTFAADETSASDIDLEPGMRVYYRVIAVGSAGDLGSSSVVGATTTAAVPDAPHDLLAFATSDTRIHLNWWD
jgi:titin